MFGCICLVLFSVSCAATKLENRPAQEVIARQLDVPEKSVHVSSVSSLSDTALVETVLRVTFVLQKDGSGKWHVVRMQHAADRWETPEEFLKSVDQSQFQKSLGNAFQALLLESANP
jgi:hypothetical protein